MLRGLKGIGKEFQQLVIRRYLEKSIQKKLFAIYSHYNKEYFSRKKRDVKPYSTTTHKKAQFVKFTVAVYVLYFYGRDVAHWFHRQ